MFQKSLSELAMLLAKKKCSSLELTQNYIQRINQFDKKLNSFISVCTDSALKESKNADEIRAKSKEPLPPLLGMPIAHKDIFCTQDVKTSCGSKMLDNFISPYDGFMVHQLKQNGCILLGKTNMDEFAMGSSNETSFYGPVKNPWNLEAVPGGSSGGSAAAVSARLTPGATGSDTGGSIRQPAAFCGITGIKPSYGRISRFGMIAFASSLDQAGPMAQSAEDCALLLEAMSGHDLKDSSSIQSAVPQYSQLLNQSVHGLRVGLPKEYFTQNLNSSVAKSTQDCIEILKSLGVKFIEISLPNTALSLPAYYILAPAECSANLARYDGVRFGHRSEQAQNIEELYKKSRSEGFGAEVKRRIIMGTYVLTSGYYDAYFVKAQKIRRLIANDFKLAFEKVDVILSPTAPSAAFALGEKAKDPLSMYLSDVFTLSASLSGLPALSMPCGFDKGLPLGTQLIGNYLAENKILNLAHAFQQQSDWHKKMPVAFVEQN